MMTHEEETLAELEQLRRLIAVKERAPLDGRVVDEMEYRRSLAGLRAYADEIERLILAGSFGDAA